MTSVLSQNSLQDQPNMAALWAWLRSPKRFNRTASILILVIFFYGWSQLFFSSFEQTPMPPTPTTTSADTPMDTRPTQNDTQHWPQLSSWKKDAWSFTPEVGPIQPSPSPDGRFLRALQAYTVQGHDVPTLAKSIPSLGNEDVDMTVILPVDTLVTINAQLTAILQQTIQPKFVWLVCPSSLRRKVQDAIPKSAKIEFKVLTVDHVGDYPRGSAGRASWLQLLSSVRTEYVWVLDGSVEPGSRYLQYMYGLMQTDAYANGLLGTVGAVLPSNLNADTETNILCLPAAYGDLPKVSQPADLLFGAWLLRRAWLPFLTVDARLDALSVPLPRYISQSLLHYANVPTVAVPLAESSQTQLMSDEKIAQHCNALRDTYHQTEHDGWFRLRSLRTSPTALDYRQITIRQQKHKLHTVLFVVDGSEQAVALHPLLCRYNYSVHVAVTGAHRGLSGATFRHALDESGCTDVTIHDVDIQVNDDLSTAATTSLAVTELIKVLRPRALLYIQQNHPISRSLEATAQIHDIVRIGLPAEDVRHALWIPDVPLDALQYWNTISVNLVVITDRRPHSFSRLLQSASRSHYLGDKVNLMVHMEQSADRVTRMLVNSFSWRHGDKITRHRIRKGGLMPAIVESWYPSGNDDYAILLEDDIEVSPMFYAWAKYAILKYRYDAHTDTARTLYGISLYSPRNLELLPAGRVSFDPNSVILPQYPARIPYVSQVPCSWGAVYFPEHWREFHEYLTRRLEDTKNGQQSKITVPNSRSERWKKSWKKYYIELVYLRGYVMLYPNFQNFESFSTNHLEFGTHVKKGRSSKMSEFLVPLMKKDTILTQLPERRLPKYDDLPALDLWGQLKTLEELDNVGAAWHKQVSTCKRSSGRFDPSDMLCPFKMKDEEQAKASAPAPTKKPKVVRTKKVVEPLAFKTIYVDPDLPADLISDDHPKPIDVSQLPLGQTNSTLSNDEKDDLETDLPVLDRLYYNVHPEELDDMLQDEALGTFEK